MNILYVPLDERPCNAIYPEQTAAVNQTMNVLSVPQALLGNKRNQQISMEFAALLKEHSKLFVCHYFYRDAALWRTLTISLASSYRSRFE